MHELVKTVKLVYIGPQIVQKGNRRNSTAPGCLNPALFSMSSSTATPLQNLFQCHLTISSAVSSSSGSLRFFGSQDFSGIIFSASPDMAQPS
ncbi:hypothetical protein CEXT_97371 [Caerostris extrusa]|uniref:Ycf15 n=1 Tax=Caerostris extrusa TaxID=172846 RepID=A0AAV4M8L6_CAEEX|nr:hypothetical protein CEXT_97371 [Caerostris extrusa]